MKRISLRIFLLYKFAIYFSISLIYKTNIKILTINRYICIFTPQNKREYVFEKQILNIVPSKKQ